MRLADDLLKPKQHGANHAAMSQAHEMVLL